MAQRRRGTGWLYGASVVMAAVLSSDVLASAGDPSRPDATRQVTLRGNVNPATRVLLGRALEGAAARLDEPACRAVFTDFRDGSGRRLDEVLADSGLSGREYLGLLYFVDGSTHPRCGPRNQGSDGLVAAFTGPGMRVIRICPGIVRGLSKRDPARAEALLIHELLHALGLPENPPTPGEITEQVGARCFADGWGKSASRRLARRSPATVP